MQKNGVQLSSMYEVLFEKWTSPSASSLVSRQLSSFHKRSLSLVLLKQQDLQDTAVFLPLKFLQHALLPCHVPVHFLISIPRIRATVAVHQFLRVIPAHLPDFLLACVPCIHESLRGRRLPPKPDQFANFSNRCFLMNSLFPV